MSLWESNLKLKRVATFKKAKTKNQPSEPKDKVTEDPSIVGCIYFEFAKYVEGTSGENETNGHDTRGADVENKKVQESDCSSISSRPSSSASSSSFRSDKVRVVLKKSRAKPATDKNNMQQEKVERGQWTGLCRKLPGKHQE